jgi:rSAM/selenodomain-associated transferase 1
MAKAPVPGRCKTRMMPALNADQAAALSAAFLGDITENLHLAARQAPITPYLAFAPAGAEALFDGLLAPRTHLILADGSIAAPPGVQGFGICLLHAIQTMLAAGHSAACVLNSDSPTLPTAALAQAATWLATPGPHAKPRVVLGPADDGGYYLLGMTSAHAHLFRDIAWSTDTVAAQTRARAAEAGLELLELPTWYDVDDAAALRRLRAELADPAACGFHAPRTAAALAGMADRQAAA